jgi:hypothetical protein
MAGKLKKGLTILLCVSAQNEFVAGRAAKETEPVV